MVLRWVDPEPYFARTFKGFSADFFFDGSWFRLPTKIGISKETKAYKNTASPSTNTTMRCFNLFWQWLKMRLWFQKASIDGWNQSWWFLLTLTKFVKHFNEFSRHADCMLGFQDVSKHAFMSWASLSIGSSYYDPELSHKKWRKMMQKMFVR